MVKALRGPKHNVTQATKEQKQWEAAKWQSMASDRLDTVTAADLSLELTRRYSLSREKPDLPAYELLEVLGSGAFGEVYKAVQKSTGQMVAVKVLFAVSDGFREEVTRLSQVSDHPNIVTLVDANLDFDPPFLVTPYLTGSLQAKLPSGPQEVDIPRVTRWFEEIAQALQFVHGRGILHCDIKPANILLGEDDQARLVDFGQSVGLQDQEFRLGSFWFMPWQQARLPGQGAELPQVGWDIYALGATIYTLLTGQLPRATESARQSLSQLRTGRDKVEQYRELVKSAPLVPICQLNPKVDPDLAAIVESCLEQVGSTSYSSASEVLADLRRRREKLPVKARPWTRLYWIERFLARHRLSVMVTALAFGILLSGLSWSSYQVYQARQARQALIVAQYERGLSHLERGRSSGLVWLAEACRQDSNEEYRAVLQEKLASQLRIASPQLYGLRTYTAPSPSGTRGIGRHPQDPDKLVLFDLTDGSLLPLPPEVLALGFDQKDTVRYRLDGVVLDPVLGAGGPATWRLPPWESVSPANHQVSLALLVRPELTLHAKRSKEGFQIFDSQDRLRFEAKGVGFTPAPTFSLRGDLAVSWEDRTVEVYLRENKWTAKKILDKDFQSELFCFSKDSNRLAGYDGKSLVRVWDLDGKVLANLEIGAYVNDMAFDQEGELLVCVSRDAMVRGFHLSTGEPAWSPAEMEKSARWVFVQANGQVVTMSDEVTVWQAPTLEQESPQSLETLVNRVALWTGWVYDENARVRTLTREEYWEVKSPKPAAD